MDGQRLDLHVQSLFSNGLHHGLFTLGVIMKYLGYEFYITDNAITFDNTLRLKGHQLEQGWNELPEKWKDGDIFELVLTEAGRVILQRKLE
jgi:hypothetical protein